jgi:hypothetical protein
MLCTGQRQQILKGKPQSNHGSPSDRRYDELLSKLADLRKMKDVHILADSSMCLGVAARASYYSRPPRTDILLGLNQLCISRSLITNIDILGLRAYPEMHDDALSPFLHRHGHEALPQRQQCYGLQPPRKLLLQHARGRHTDRIGT